MNSRTYNVGKLRKLIREESSEFKPVLGKNVTQDNKRNNGKAYSDIEKSVKDYNGGILNDNKKSTPINAAVNYGMNDLQYANMTPEFSKKIKSQYKGYANDEAEKLHKNDAFGNATFGSEESTQNMLKHAKDAQTIKKIDKETGLKSKEIKKRMDTAKLDDNDETVAESKIKVLTFKRELFLNEDKVMGKIPDSYKRNGNRFVMKDGNGNEFLVEWNSRNTSITKRVNRKQINEDISRIKYLFGYKGKESIQNTSPQERLNEVHEYDRMLGKVRKLMK
jgi:hypothetical protein